MDKGVRETEESEGDDMSYVRIVTMSSHVRGGEAGTVIHQGNDPSLPVDEERNRAFNRAHFPLDRVVKEEDVSYPIAVDDGTRFVVVPGRPVCFRGDVYRIRHNDFSRRGDMITVNGVPLSFHRAEYVDDGTMFVEIHGYVRFCIMAMGDGIKFVPVALSTTERPPERSPFFIEEQRKRAKLLRTESKPRHATMPSAWSLPMNIPLALLLLLGRRMG